MESTEVLKLLLEAGGLGATLVVLFLWLKSIREERDDYKKRCDTLQKRFDTLQHQRADELEKTVEALEKTVHTMEAAAHLSRVLSTPGSLSAGPDSPNWPGAWPTSGREPPSEQPTGGDSS